MNSDHRAIQNVLHNEGIPGIERLIEDGCSHHSLRRTLKELREAGIVDKADELEAVLVARKVIRPRHRPTKPKPGDSRRFKIQQGRGTKYLRLPVDGSFPERDAGEELEAKFDEGGIEVRNPEVQS